MNLHWQASSYILDWISLTNKGWHTWEPKRGVSTYAIGYFGEHRDVDNLVAQEVAQLRIGIGLLIKQFETMNSKKVNVVGS